MKLIDEYRKEIFLEKNNILKEYKKLDIKYNHIINMIDCLILKSNEFSLDKYFRWYGFIQGYLFKEKILDYNEQNNKKLFEKLIKNYQKSEIDMFVNYSLDIKNANIQILESYKKYIDKISIHNLLAILIIKPENFSIEEHSKWLGFIQAYLVYNKLVAIEQEINYTQDVFQKIYKKFNIKPYTIIV